MTTPQAPSTPDQTWGATPAPAAKPAWSPGKKVAAGAVAAVIVAGGGAAIWAASSSAATDAQAGPGGMTGGPGGMAGGGLGGALHGEYVASDGNGGYVTKIMQTGEVTELSATSLTAKSDDGFSKTYTITSAQATGLATGDTVTVVATESGSTATATSVTDGESGPQGQQGQAPGGGQGTPPSGAPAQTG
ncbi:hypothetical protein AB0J55_26185 [Amycolatopsis sp. NPDC049688]|uniref:hypothetical protein n=1 Tax=Amycolatopsis sp. NPDC049688 TaxID=3154733 RepID=UPI00343A5EAE